MAQWHTMSKMYAQRGRRREKVYKSVLCIEKRQKLFLNFRNTRRGLFVNMLLKAKLNDLNNYAVVSWHQSQVKKKNN